MPRVKLRPYGVILKMPANPRFKLKAREMTVRIWARDREHALSEAVDIYGGEAIAAQHCPLPLP
jgi:hypothetical protein